MPMVQLSAHFVSSAQCPQGKKVDYYDTSITGFILEVRPTGTSTYHLRYRDTYGRQRQYKIGDSKSLTFEKARQAAKVLRSKVVLGDSPIEERLTKRTVPTLGEFIEDTYFPYIKTNKRNTGSEQSFIKGHLIPRFGTVPMSEITQPALLECHQEMLAQGYAKATSNRSLIFMKTMFNLAKKFGVPGSEVNPAVGIKISDPLNACERYLTKEEAQRLLIAIDGSDNQQLKYIIPLLLLTGARKREILEARWEEVSFERRTLRVPLSKSGKSRLVPLSGAAISILERVPRIAGCPFVFVNPQTLKPFTNIYFSWNNVRVRAGLPNVRLHDLRHTYASNLVNSGTSIYVVSKALGHASLKNTERYSHLSQETLSAAADSVAQAIDVNWDTVGTAS